MVNGDPYMHVIPVGGRVEFIDCGKVGIVTQVCIQAGEKVSYEVTWWANDTRNVAWVSAVEIRQESPTAMQRIGFLAREQMNYARASRATAGIKEQA